MQHFKLVNSWFRFLMSRTGYWVSFRFKLKFEFSLYITFADLKYYITSELMKIGQVFGERFM